LRGVRTLENLTLLLVAMIVPFALALCYMTPAAIALKRRHPQKDTIRAVNLFLGWTVIGWLAAWIWALSAGDRSVVAAPGFAHPVEPHLSIAPNAMNEIRTEVMNVSQRNDDGSDRDALVRRLLPGQDLRLVRARKRDGSPGKVEVCLADGRQIGELSPDVAARIAMNLDGNRRVDCRVLDVTGANGRGYRVHILLAIHLLRSPAPTRAAPPRRPLSAAGSA
jgi:hypothetical protein